AARGGVAAAPDGTRAKAAAEGGAETGCRASERAGACRGRDRGAGATGRRARAPPRRRLERRCHAHRAPSCARRAPDAAAALGDVVRAGAVMTVEEGGRGGMTPMIFA